MRLKYEKYLDTVGTGLSWMLAGTMSVWFSPSSIILGGAVIALYGIAQAFRYAPR